MLDASLVPFRAQAGTPDTLANRLGIFAVCLALGIWMIYVGRLNVRTRMAEESGKRGLFFALLGKPKVHTGRWAVAMGWIRIVVGAVAILFGLVFLVLGPFLKK